MTITNSKWELKTTITLLRVLVGWHFLYEGIIKIYNPDWSSFGYLASAQGPLRTLFTSLTDDAIIGWVDAFNYIALILVGITLILGVFEKLGAFVGIVLLALYYLAHPPFPWLDQINVEGSYWFVNKNLIELVACIIILQCPTGDYFGLRNIFSKNKQQTKTEEL